MYRILPNLILTFLVLPICAFSIYGQSKTPTIAYTLERLNLIKLSTDSLLLLNELSLKDKNTFLTGAIQKALENQDTIYAADLTYKKLDKNILARNFDEDLFSTMELGASLITACKDTLIRMNLNSITSCLHSITSNDSLFIKYNSETLETIKEIRASGRKNMVLKDKLNHRIAYALQMQLFYGAMVNNKSVLKEISNLCKEELAYANVEDKANLYNALFVYYISIDNYYEALNAINNAIRACKNDCNVFNKYINLAVIYLEIGNAKKTVQLLETAIADLRFKNIDDKDKIRLYHLLSRAYILKEDFTNAKDYISKSDELIRMTGASPYFVNEHQYIRGLKFEKKGELQKALKEFKNVYDQKEKGYNTYWISGALSKLIAYDSLSDQNYSEEHLYLYLADTTISFTQFEYSSLALNRLVDYYLDQGKLELSKKYSNKLSKFKERQVKNINQIYRFETDRLESINKQNGMLSKSNLSNPLRLGVLIFLLLLVIILSTFTSKLLTANKEKKRLLESNKVFLDKVKELKAEMKKIETFTYQFSHDLKSPLRRITEINEILNRSPKKKDLPRLSSESTDIKKEVDALIGYLESYLNTASLKNFKREVISLADTIKSVEQIIDSSKCTTFKIISSIENINFHIVKFDLLTLLKNIFENAIAHSNMDTIIIEIKVEESKIAKFLTIENEVNQITQNNKTGHYGLGLKLCDSILKKYESELTVYFNSSNQFIAKFPIDNIIC